jgi:hypothetical protein
MHVVCAFFAAVDRGDNNAAEGLLSPQLRNEQTLSKLTRYTDKIKSRTGQREGQPPQRYFTDVFRETPSTYRLSVVSEYPNILLRQDIFIEDNGTNAQIVGLRVGPD